MSPTEAGKPTDESSAQASMPDRGDNHESGSKGEEPVIKLFAEQLRIEKRVVEGEGVRIRVVTDEVETPASVMLRAETLDIRRVPVDRVIDEMPEIREEGGVTIIPVVEEVVVTEIRLVLKEELHIRRVATTREHQEVVTLRRQRAEVEHLPSTGKDLDKS